jgi:hypothetical protein
MFFTIGGSVIAGEIDRIILFNQKFFLGSVIGSVSGLYRGIRETRDLTGSIRTSSYVLFCRG